MIGAIILAVLFVGYIVYLIASSGRPKSISEQLRGNDEKYE